ncbi:MAG: DinB family protein [Rhodococcus sp. (in: high G+C Gram-positive bacteria)]|uniref:DinB family protein n=1 Tax=Rhodococcus sp. TaxID=1831 RepID=UPI003BAF27D6
MGRSDPVDRSAIIGELERTRVRLHQLLGDASDESLRRPSAGTRWTNEQLLFHMVFGYMVVQALLPLVRVISRLPAGVGRRFARLLDAGTRPFDVVNYYGSCAATLMFNRRRMGAKLDRVIASLVRRLQRESDEDLRRGMPFPARWDPYFTDFMTIAEVYLYPTQHFDFHEKQLTLDRPT